MTFILQKKHQTIVWNNSQSKKRRRKLKIPPYIICGFILIALSFFIALMHGIIKKNLPVKKVSLSIPIEKEFITPNEYSRPQEELKKVTGIVIHYVGNPGTSAMANRNYFESLKDSKATSASSHYIIGLEGEVVQCIPLNEIAYASNDRNKDTIAIEVCHPDDTGKYTKESYQSLIKLVAWLCGKYNIKTNQIIRHYDVTGKLCPKYYVEHEDEWKQLRLDVKNYIEKNGKR